MHVWCNLTWLAHSIPHHCCSALSCSPGTLQVLDNGRRLHLGEAADATRSALSGIFKNITSALQSPFRGLQNAAQDSPTGSIDEPQLETAGPSMQSMAPLPQADTLPAGTSIKVSVRAPDASTDASPIEARLAGTGMPSFVHLQATVLQLVIVMSCSTCCILSIVLL